jgi:hypothetical protein
LTFAELSRARVGLLVVMSPQTDYNKGQKEKGKGQRYGINRKWFAALLLPFAFLPLPLIKLLPQKRGARCLQG